MTWLTRLVTALALLVPTAVQAQPACAESARFAGLHVMPADVGMATMPDGSEVLSITGTALRAPRVGQYILLDADGVVAQLRLTRQRRELHQGRFFAEFEPTTALAREAREGRVTNERNYHHVIVGPLPRRSASASASARLLFAGAALAGSPASVTPDRSPRLQEGTFGYAVDLDGDSEPDLSFQEHITDTRSGGPHTADVTHVASTSHYACAAWRESDQLTWVTRTLIGP